MTLNSAELILHLREEEKKLFRRHGIRLHIDGLSFDGSNAFCTACQVRRPLFSMQLEAHQLVSCAHHALRLLYQAGISPMITLVPRRSGRSFKRMNKQDPFGISCASAILENMLLPPSGYFSADQPQAVPTVGKRSAQG